MSNSPSHSKPKRGIPPSTPKPDQIRDLRFAASLTQTEAAKLVYVILRTWQRWEASEDDPTRSVMPAAAWELFVLKTHALGAAIPDYLRSHIEEIISRLTSFERKQRRQI